MLGVSSRSMSSSSMPAWSAASRPASAWAISPSMFATAARTPLPPNRRLSPSRSSTASWAPVEAPEGTAARPERPVRQDDVDLDGRVAAGVENLAPVDAGNRRGSAHAVALAFEGAVVAGLALAAFARLVAAPFSAGVRIGRSWSTETPGSSRPSRNSSEAPPPVEMCVNRSARPCCWIAATESPPPTTTVAPASARAAR